MGKDLILVAVGGLAAGALFGSIVTGSLGSALLAYFAAAPLFLVGLSLGWLPAAAAALIGAVTVAGIIGFFTAGYFALVVGLPVTVLCRQALLSRPDGRGSVEWYPPGRLVAALTAMTAAALTAMFAVAVLEGVDPQQEVQRTIESVLDAGMPPEVAERAKEQGLVVRAASFLPGIAAALLFLTLALDGVLGQAIAARLGIARRPSPPWRGMALPAWPLYALGLSCLAGIAASGTLEYIGRNLAIVFAVPFLLQGLAVVHAVAARLPGRTVWLVGFYLLGLVMAWPFVLVAALGLAEPYVGLRARFGGGPKENE